MKQTPRILYIVTIATFLSFFVIEAILWTYPMVYSILVPQLNPTLAVDQATQAAVLRALFINQGVYNLMAAAAGMTGLYFIKRGSTATGNAFVVYTCVFGMLAAATLILSTHAYALGAAQLAFPAATLILVRKSSSSSPPRTD